MNDYQFNFDPSMGFEDYNDALENGREEEDDVADEEVEEVVEEIPNDDDDDFPGGLHEDCP